MQLRCNYSVTLFSHKVQRLYTPTSELQLHFIHFEAATLEKTFPIDRIHLYLLLSLCLRVYQYLYFKVKSSKYAVLHVEEVMRGGSGAWMEYRAGLARLEKKPCAGQEDQF